MKNINQKNLYEHTYMIWEQLCIKLSKKLSNNLEEKIRGKVLSSIMTQIDNDWYFQTLNKTNK